MRVPMIARWPGKIPAGRVCRDLTLSMDLCPTLAAIGGSEVPRDRIIDGKDIQPILYGDNEAKTEHDAFFYYNQNVLEAVRSGKWKLHIRREVPRKKGNLPVPTVRKSVMEELKELYDLELDISEKKNVYDKHPDVVAMLLEKVKSCRKDIGDNAVGIIGENVRSAGCVKNPNTLTCFDPEHPYMMAMYDTNERG